MRLIVWLLCLLSVARMCRMDVLQSHLNMFKLRNFTLVDTSVRKDKQKRLTVSLPIEGIDSRMILFAEQSREDPKILVFDGGEPKSHSFSDLDVFFVVGHVEGLLTQSHVNGFVQDGRFFGTLHFGQKLFYLEPVHRFPEVVAELRTLAVMYQPQNLSLKEMVTRRSSMLNSISYRVPVVLEKKDADTTREHDYKSKVCPVLMLADPSFYVIVGNRSLVTTAATLMLLLDRANSIFRTTDFDNDGRPDNVGLRVQFIVMYINTTSPMNSFPRDFFEPINSSIYIQMLSSIHMMRTACLGIGFTAIPFLDNVLGASFVGYPLPPILSLDMMLQESNGEVTGVGGICERPTVYGNSLNVLTVTLTNSKGERVPQVVSELSLAHELGHGFGSNHDPDSTRCMLHIMASFTRTGEIRSEHTFSECSRRSIYRVLKVKSFCFEPSTEPYCGNGIIEKGEDCDCGILIDCMRKDACCVRTYHDGAKPCTVNKKNPIIQCHPSQGQCCDDFCRYKNLSAFGLDCSNFATKCPCKNSPGNCRCGVDSYCLGNTCNSNECHRIGMKECSCPQSSGSKCQICCTNGDDEMCETAIAATKKHFQNATIGDIRLLRSFKHPSKGSLFVTQQFCVNAANCVELSFLMSGPREYCTNQGNLGTCMSNGVCNTTVSDIAIYPKLLRQGKNKIHPSALVQATYLLLFIIFRQLFVD